LGGERTGEGGCEGGDGEDHGEAAARDHDAVECIRPLVVAAGGSDSGILGEAGEYLFSLIDDRPDTRRDTNRVIFQICAMEEGHSNDRGSGLESTRKPEPAERTAQTGEVGWAELTLAAVRTVPGRGGHNGAVSATGGEYAAASFSERRVREVPVVGPLSCLGDLPRIVSPAKAGGRSTPDEPNQLVVDRKHPLLTRRLGIGIDMEAAEETVDALVA